MSEIRRLDEKFDMFVDMQKQINIKLSDSIEKISDTMSNQQAQQVEINTAASHIDDLVDRQIRFDDRLSKLETNQAVIIADGKKSTVAKNTLYTGVIAVVVSLATWFIKGE